jgi:DNA-binding HxlR family transcriptional regulator
MLEVTKASTVAEGGTMRGPICCHARAVLNRVGDQWSCLIIQTLLGGTHRFGELKTAVEGISPRVLSQCLNSLHRDGLIERKAYPTIPPRVEYTNTALGRSLAKALMPLVRWAETNQPTVDANRVKFEKKEQKRNNLPL